MRVAIVGGGIAGLAAAHDLLTVDAPAGESPDVVVFERASAVGGKMQGGPFAGLPYVDSGPDAFLARVPDATRLASEVGLDGAMTHPEKVGAAVWHRGLHDIPEGLVLGVPGKLLPLARTSLLSPRGKARAALDIVLPRTSTDGDSIGEHIRARLGDEVHERLVDALVGSIYAADTDRFSLDEVPQLAALTKKGRSLILSGRAMASGSGTAAAAQTPVFAAPQGGMAALCSATAARITAAGGQIECDVDVAGIEPAGQQWRLSGNGSDALAEPFDAVVLATPAATAAKLLGSVAADSVDLLAQAELADVVMVTMHTPADRWPNRLRGKSGYLVPKPVQRDVTAVSFASQKWGHWQPPSGGQILRVSLGRDGVSPLHLDDDTIIERAVTDLSSHLSVGIEPIETRVTRWPGAFPQYRPHHRSWVDKLDASLPAGIYTAGAPYNGIGIPACIRDGRNAAARARSHTSGLRNSSQ